MPPPPLKISTLPPYPNNLSRPLNLTLFPLDITTPHQLHRLSIQAKLAPLVEAGSPLAEWTSAFVNKTLAKIESLTRTQENPGLELHDPLCIWYMLTRSAPSWMLAPKAPEDIRVETAGQWTRGMHVVDRRMRRKKGVDPSVTQVKSPGAVDIADPMEVFTLGNMDGEGGDAPGDNGGWLVSLIHIPTCNFCVLFPLAVGSMGLPQGLQKPFYLLTAIVTAPQLSAYPDISLNL
jgi:hypothetical protein